MKKKTGYAVNRREKTAKQVINCEEELTMEQSTELRDLVLQYYKALSSGDISFIENLFSQNAEVLAVGSDANEWWAGYKTIVSVFKAQLEEIKGAKFGDADTKAYNEGNVGWAASQVLINMPDNQEITFRMTFVFHKENGSWKVVPAHTSAGVLNEDLIGRKLTT
jgi:ketosteroid isomerase-like protein